MSRRAPKVQPLHPLDVDAQLRQLVLRLLRAGERRVLRGGLRAEAAPGRLRDRVLPGGRGAGRGLVCARARGHGVGAESNFVVSWSMYGTLNETLSYCLFCNFDSSV